VAGREIKDHQRCKQPDARQHPKLESAPFHGREPRRFTSPTTTTTINKPVWN
jgi:hypothetical protein